MFCPEPQVILSANSPFLFQTKEESLKSSQTQEKKLLQFIMPFNSARVLNTNDGEYYPMSTIESESSDKSVYR
jgi:hypothetical protein